MLVSSPDKLGTNARLAPRPWPSRRRIDAHAQPGEPLHRNDGFDDLVELWADRPIVSSARGDQLRYERD